ncbi:MAG: hypothetical protein J3K34DRAFT_79701 [Monoraphidium minutum]|nr:MAG: hypothetical protein J3K34DRAFT_79701 [Monoraphidium minutum]
MHPTPTVPPLWSSPPPPRPGARARELPCCVCCPVRPECVFLESGADARPPLQPPQAARAQAVDPTPRAAHRGAPHPLHPQGRRRPAPRRPTGGLWGDPPHHGRRCCGRRARRRAAELFQTQVSIHLFATGQARVRVCPPAVSARGCAPCAVREASCGTGLPRSLPH